MPAAPLSIPFPIRGISQVWSATEQPPRTTPDAQNMRAVDARSGRARGARRPGLTKYLAAQISGGSPVVEMASVVKPNTNLGTFTPHTALSAADLVWSRKIPAGANIGDNCGGIAVDGGCNVYAIAGDCGVVKLNADGEELWFHPVELEQDVHALRWLQLDGEGNLYVCVAGVSGTDGPVIKYRILDDGLEFLWRIVPPNGGLTASFAAGPGYLYLLENTSATTCELHRYEGTDTSAPALLWSCDSGASSIFGASVGYHVAIGPDGSAYVSIDKQASEDPALVRVAPNGAVVWEYQPSGEGGVGYGCVPFAGGVLYTVGPTNTGTQVLRKLLDTGSGVSVVWAQTTANVPETDYKGLSIAVDRAGNVYYAVNSASGDAALVKLDGSDGSVIWSLDSPATFNLGEPDVVAIGDDYPGGGDHPEFVYVGGTRTGPNEYYAVHKVRVGAYDAIGNDPPRTLVNVAVAGGNVVTFTAGGVSTPTGGSGALNTQTRWAMAQTAFGRVYLLDGERYRVYDPVADEVTAWTSRSGGCIPPRAKIIGLFNGRIVLAHWSDDPHLWAMSAVADPHDWNFDPVETSPTQAIAGADSRAGPCPDVINAVMPWGDDLAVFGGDHSIHRMTGDPAAGGVFDLVSDVTGVAFGRAWCKDPRGTLYFFGSQGGVYEMPPGGVPQRLRGSTSKDDENEIDDLLGEVDVGANRIRLAWNDRERGVHVFITPYAGGQTDHFYWCARTRSWWKDRFPDAMNPMSVMVADGDAPGNRVLLLGGSDGYVRKWDPEAATDDGTAIDSYVVLGPMMPAGPDRETGYHDWRAVLASGSGSVGYEVFVGDNPEWSVVGQTTAALSGTWGAGRNPPVWARCRGYAAFVKLRHNASGWWGYESLTVGAAAAGTVRDR